ncbi:FG-GAP-like repeat-containing protein [Streptomyces sp. SID13588]|uniref:FG-GAP-like repeat-containing protein n=1 Tax=Streptomyces sp. SID13588 TaxID=2706051 RepID=UPI0013D99B15
MVAGSFGLTGALVPVTAAAVPQTAGVVDPVAAGAISAEDQALQQAQATHAQVEVVSARTEESDQWANPDGTFSTITHGSPVRLWRDGAWVDTDPKLVFAADGRVVPKVSTVAAIFSGGGTVPLVSTVKDGRTLSLSWPTALPKPTLVDNIATYPEVLPGVDLRLKAEVEGFSQVLVVKTPEAAKNPALATLNYKIDTTGLSVAADAATGTVTAVDSAGQTLFSSPAAAMWDSTSVTSQAPAAQGLRAAAQAETAPWDLFEPAPGAKDALMPTTITGGTLNITPDQPLLTAADTQYPVYIDPQFTRAWGKLNDWTRIYNRRPKNSYWNANDVARVGHESDTNGTSASFFAMETSGLKGAGVIASTFRIKNTWSWSCTKTPVELWQVDGISKNTTWENPPTKKGGSPQFTVTDAKGWGTGCPADNLEFNATRAVLDASGRGEDVTLGLYAPSLTDTFQWKKFDPKTATLETKYNHPPKLPTKLDTNPHRPCTGGADIGDTRISLLAYVDDEDAGNLTTTFQIFAAGASTPLATNTKSALKHNTVTWSVPDTTLISGSYEWQVKSTDQQGASSPWTAKCKFTVDRKRPASPPAVSSTQFPSGDAGWPYATTQQARSAGSLTLGASGVKDVLEYNWWTDWEPQVRQEHVAPGADATGLSFTPPSYGPHLIYAFSLDGAGNRSDTATYLFYANANPDGKDSPNDLNGDGKNDIWSADGNGTLLSSFGQGNGQFSNTVSGGRTFASDSQVASRGDWGDDGYNDLVSLEVDQNSSATPKPKVMWLTPNSGLGVAVEEGVDGGRQQLTVSSKPQTNSHWAQADQIATPGDITADLRPDLLVKESGILWAYTGSTGSLKKSPVPLGSADWNGYTVITPGDVNGDNLPDLLLRKDDNGDILAIYGTALDDGQASTTPRLDTASWSVSKAKVLIKALATKDAYPLISSSGDTNGDGVTDLWARKAGKEGGSLDAWPGTPSAPGSKILGSFGTVTVIDGVTGGVRLPAGTMLNNGQSLSAHSSKLALNDGILTITTNTNPARTIWSAGKPGHPDAKALVDSDGNLAICAPAGTIAERNDCQNDTTGAAGKRLWSTHVQGPTTANPNAPTPTPNGYALLQNRGTLAVYNAKSQSLWSSGTNVRHDYNSDGRSDMGALYSHPDGSYELYSFNANADGTFAAPFKGYTAPPGSAWAANMKYATGDYNGDGIGDVAILYGYSNGSVRLFTATGRADGTFTTPTASWYRPAGSWWFNQMYLQSGDFNGDGRDDLAVWYDYTDGHDTLFTFTATPAGGFNEPFPSWTRPAGNWEIKQAKFAIGDYNGDGRDDLAVFYGYGDMNTVKLHTFLANPTGGFDYTTTSWTSTTWGSWNQAHIQAGDFNGDGTDDIAAWYDYSDGHDSLNTFVSLGTTTGTFQTPYSAWSSAAGNFYYASMPQMVAGDYNGDGRDDLGVMYGYGTGYSRMLTWIAKSDNSGTFNAMTPSTWTSVTGTWTNNDVHFFNTHS